MAREEDKARSVRPITSGSLSYKAGTAPGATGDALGRRTGDSDGGLGRRGTRAGGVRSGIDHALDEQEARNATSSSVVMSSTSRGPSWAANATACSGLPMA